MRNVEPISLPRLPEQPLFSILIRNYNYGHFLGMALQSVLDQTYSNFEVIVCDDGSTDNSREVAEEYARKNPRIRLIAQKNQGVATAANAAYADSKGDPIAFLDADDTFRPSKLEKVLSAFRNNPRSGLCVNPVLPVLATGRPLGPPFPARIESGWVGPARLKAGGCGVFPPSSGLTFRRGVASLIFPIPADIRIMEDFFLAGSAQFVTEVSVVPEALTEFGVHKSTSGDSSRDGPRPAFSTFAPEVHVSCANAIEKVLPAQREFLHRFYGRAISDALRLEDNPWYWDVLLSIRVLKGRRDGLIRPYSLEEMIRHVPRPAERRLWRAILLLPQPLAKRAYQFWRSPSRAKSIVKAAVLPWIRR
jgi:glycosyltransferase involved in cell wall biosynthesis